MAGSEAFWLRDFKIIPNVAADISFDIHCNNVMFSPATTQFRNFGKSISTDS